MNTETRVVKLTVITDFVRPTFILALVPPSNSPSLFFWSYPRHAPTAMLASESSLMRSSPVNQRLAFHYASNWNTFRSS